jgi:amino acid adenylation domain-containing protein
MTMNVPYTRSHGGANRSNRGLIEGLARRGHETFVVAPALAQPSPISYEEWIEELAALSIAVAAEDEDTVAFTWGGVRVFAVRQPGRVRGVLARMIERLSPDRVLVSSEDPSQSLLAAALDRAPGRVVYLALTPPLFPFGPESLYPSELRTALVRRVATVGCLSRVVADYVQQHAGVPAFVYAPPSFGSGPFPVFDAFDDGAVLLMNACAVKGLSIFLELARRFPKHRFAALPGYGTTAADRDALAQHPNVEVWRNERELDDIFCRTKIVVVPTLWMESFGMVVVDAMLRGIPVLAADHGALPEASLATAMLLPVRPITGYKRELDDNLLPVPLVPDQDAAPWAEALGALANDRARWLEASHAARSTAIRYVDGLNVEAFERTLVEIPESRAAPVADVVASPKSATAALNAQQRAELLRRLRAGTAMPQTAETIRRVARDGPLPLSFAQRRLYFLWRLDPTSAAYNCSSAVRLRGALDVAALERALGALVERHETFRTLIVDGEAGPLQKILPPAAPAFECHDLTGHLPERAQATAEALLAHAAARPFDLSHDPPFRALLMRVGADEYLLSLNIHHIATDGWSAPIVLDDLFSFYRAITNGESHRELSLRGIDYADYASWQVERLTGPELTRLLDYWTGSLAGAPLVVELPADRPRPASPMRPGGNCSITVSRDVVEGLRNVGKRSGATPFMTLLAGFGVLLHRLGRVNDIVIGCPVANRPRAELERLVGFFANTLPLRLRFDGNPAFTDLLDTVRATVVGGLAHQALPFERLVEALAPPRTRSHTPVFQVLFSLHSMPPQGSIATGLSAEPFTVYGGTAKLDLNLELTETDHGLEGTLEYDAELFDRDTAECLAQSFTNLLGAIAAAPDRRIGALQLTKPVEAPLSLPSGDPDLISMIRRGAALNPAAPAVWCKGAAVDHRELGIWSNRIAAGLVASGLAKSNVRLHAASDHLVAICLDRSIAMVAAVLGVLKAGAACVPLDPALPSERLAWMRSDIAPSAIITERRYAGLFADAAELVIILDDPKLALPAVGSDWQGPAPRPDGLAYLLYTSGSTGRPKGVSFPHAALANLILWHVDKFPGPTRMLQFASLGFDSSFREILAALASGGTIYLLDETGRRDLDGLPSYLNGHRIETAILPVVAIHRLAEAMMQPGAPPLTLKHLISTGEALKVTPAIEAWLAQVPELSLHNDYGPTETHVVTSVGLADLPDHGAPVPPIGRAIRGTGLRILDAYFNPVPRGFPGELFVAGVCLARGYHAQPAATAEKFLPDASSSNAGGRVYRTGDLVREGRDGMLAYLGRIDQQVKIRGHRIEPGEVEAVLREVPGVADSLVVPRGVGEDRRLVAYIVADRGSAAPAPRLLAAHLRSKLPIYMVPAAFVLLDRFPLTTNGKIDRRALPEPAAVDNEAGEDFEGGAPRSELETILAGIWCDVLKRPALGIDDNFFALGGHSLLLIQVCGRIAQKLNVELSVRQFFDHPTVRTQARVVDELLAVPPQDDPLEALLDEIEALPEEEARRLVGLEGAHVKSTQAVEAWLSAASELGCETRPAPIGAIGFPSSGRAELLERAVRSFAANLLAHDRRVDIVIASDPSDDAADATYRSTLGRLARETGLPMRYAGHWEKRAYVDRLAEASDVEPALIAWAIGDDTRSGRAWSANRNALLLDAAGGLALVFDDDATARLRLPRVPCSGIKLQSNRCVSELRMLSDGAKAEDFAVDARVDLVGAHQEMLGRSVGAILRDAGGAGVVTDGAAAEPAALGAPGEARVVATYHGWVGDSGWPSGADVRFLTGAAWEWATRSNDAYAQAIERPMVVRSVPRPVLSRAPEFFNVGAGFDAREALPPFLPRFRRADVIYGVSLLRGLPGSFVAHLPVMIGHERPRNGGTPSQDLIDVAEVVETILESVPDDAAGANWLSVGDHLTQIGGMPPVAFKNYLEDLIKPRLEHELNLLDERIRRCPADRAYWARDARVTSDILRGRLAGTGGLLPRQAFGNASAEIAQAELQRFIVDLGRLFAAWPQVMAAAARLNANGERLSQLVN